MTYHTEKQEHVEKMNARKDAAVRKLADVLVQGGHVVDTYVETYSKRLEIARVDGVRARVLVSEKRHSGHPVLRRGTGQLYITVGDYGEKRMFNEKRDQAGWATPDVPRFDYERIAAEVVNRQQYDRARLEGARKREEAQRQMNEILASINADLGRGVRLGHDEMGYMLRLPNKDVATIVDICRAALAVVAKSEE